MNGCFEWSLFRNVSGVGFPMMSLVHTGTKYAYLVQSEGITSNGNYICNEFF